MSKTYLSFPSALLLVVGLLCAGVSAAFATVGGPTYISSIAYDTQKGVVLYTSNSQDGRGCPPIIHQITTSTLQDSEVKSCDQFEEEYSFSEEGLSAYNRFIADTYKNASYLGSVSLEKNHMDIRVEFLSENSQEGVVFSSNFRATVLQDNKELAVIDFSGCTQDQPHLFEGYMVPNSDKMALLISNKENCMEGGYIGESLHMIDGVEYYDADIVRSFKTASATEPNQANVVAYASSGLAGSDKSGGIWMCSYHFLCLSQVRWLGF